MQRDQRKLAAIVCADVVGYSRLMGRDESGTLAAVKAHMRELIEPAIEAHHGRLVKTTGDGLLVEFASVVDAVRCSVEIQHGMSVRNAGAAPDRRMDYRFGINVGDVISEGDDIFGDGVNIAARLEGIADPGTICVSRAVRDQVRDKLPFAFEDLGARQLKNIARPLDVYRVRDALVRDDPSAVALPRPATAWRNGLRRRPAWGGAIVVALLGGAAWYLAAAAKPQVAMRDDAPAMSVAVLRFSDSAARAEGGLQAQRMNLDLTAELERRNRQVIVVSPGMVERYAGLRVDARQLGRELNVRYLVEGEVDQQGGSGITARLVETAKGTQVWSAKVDAGAAHAAIVSQLAEGVRAALYQAERKRAAQLAGPVANALETTLQADEMFASDTPGDLEKARALYREAVRQDPKLVPALAGLYGTIAEDLLYPRADRDAVIDKLDELSLRIVDADRNDPRAWRTRANALSWRWQWAGAFEANEQALRLDPTHVATLRQRADLLIRTGKASEALRVLDSAIALDPAGAAVPGLLSTQCHANQQLGQYEATVASCERAIALGAGWAMNYAAAAAASAQRGDMENARRFRTQALAKEPKFSIAHVKAWATSNHPEYLRQIEQHLYAGLRKAGFPET